MKEYRFKINGKEYNVNVCGIKDDQASVTVNGVDYIVGLEDVPAAGIREAGVTAPAAIRPSAAGTGSAGTPQVAGRNDVPASPVRAGGKKVEAPLPGVIIAVHATPGQAVKRGQRIAVLEAMKMENDILSPIDGTVREILVQRGDSVLEGATIATIE